MENLKTVLKVIGKENVKFPVKENKDLLCTSIDALCLDNRTYNALARNGYRTIGDIMQNLEHLCKVRGFGVKCMNRLMYEICVFQYCQLGKDEKTNYLKRIIELNFPTEQL